METSTTTKFLMGTTLVLLLGGCHQTNPTSPAPTPPPQTAAAVTLTTTIVDSATKTGSENDGTAVTFFARSRLGAYPLVVLDWDIVQIEGAMLENWLPGVMLTVEELAKKCRARGGVAGVFIEDKDSGQVLLQQARKKFPNVHAIDSKLTSVGKDERAINISGYVYNEKVKISTHAHDKVVTFKGVTRNHFITQITGFRVGDKNSARRADDLLDTFTYGVALSLGGAGGF